MCCMSSFYFVETFGVRQIIFHAWKVHQATGAPGEQLSKAPLAAPTLTLAKSPPAVSKPSTPATVSPNPTSAKSPPPSSKLSTPQSEGRSSTAPWRSEQALPEEGEASKQQRSLAPRMRFNRYLANPAKCSQLSEAFHAKLKSGRAGKTELFDIWVNHGEDWVATCEFVEIVSREKSTTKHALHAFRKRADIIKMYGGSAEKADKIIAQKRKDGLWRKDPELPDDQEEDGFWIQVEYSHAEDEKASKRQEGQMKLKVTDHATAKKLHEGLTERMNIDGLKASLGRDFDGMGGSVAAGGGESGAAPNTEGKGRKGAVPKAKGQGKGTGAGATTATYGSYFTLNPEPKTLSPKP